MTTMVVRRYAQALFNKASETHPVFADVDMIRGTLGGSPELERCLRSPVVPRQKKSSVLQSLFGVRVDAVTFRFLEILVNRGRESLLGDILDQFLSLSDEARGVTVVQARVASDLSENERTRLQDVLSSRLGGKIRLEATVDPTLMGGIVLKIGDTVYDGSVRHQLSLLHARLQVQT